MMSYVNQILDLPGKVNGMLPMNSCNDTLNNSEGSTKSWLGFVYKVLALAVLINMLYAVITGGFDALGGEGSAMSKVGSVVAMLLYIYAAFPLAQIVRNAGEEIAASTSGTVGFVFKDLVMANIKAVGYFGAMSAFFSALVGVVAWVVNADVYTYSHTLNLASGLAEMPLEVLGSLTAMIGLGEMNEVFNGLYSMNLMDAAYMGGGWSIESLVGAGMAFVAIIMMLLQLYISLAVYSFLYGMAATFVNWVKAPYLPFKSL
jgi:hypothetical protein